MLEKLGDRMFFTIVKMKLTLKDLPITDGRLDLYKLLSCWKEHNA